MDDLITARYHLTEQDYCELCVANHRYLWRRSPILWFAWVFFGGLLVLAVAGWFVSRGGAGMDPSTLLLDLPVPLLILGSLAYLFNPRNILNRLWYQYNFRSVLEGARSIEWGFDQEILWLRGHPLAAQATFIVSRELFPTIVETPKCFLFYQGANDRLSGSGSTSRGFSSPGMLRMFTELARTKGSPLRCPRRMPVPRQARARRPG